MHTSRIFLAVALAALAGAQDIDSNDIPNACQSTCNALVSSTQQCDDSTSGDDAYLQCVCGAQNAASVIPDCANCIKNNGGDADNDAFDLARKCQFSTTSSGTQSMTSTLTSGQSGASSTANTDSSMSTTGSAGSTTAGGSTSATGGAASTPSSTAPADNAGSKAMNGIGAAIALPLLAIL
ncbi:hypothetical protein CKM354_001046300 [Cercospora kikuchii]|uniref:Gpi anchored protein n=1 Tax=Cercospora kikuchii TaxID=84275 RepID=A0A9P3FKV9_9PEZI|nr:uncharacterized protein CKM354_001046300 [Cercospora kikuchii]GIZ47370.1 hypothetical protein CKM354_001046300 [Cercospora kikuchii]